MFEGIDLHAKTATEDPMRVTCEVRRNQQRPEEAEDLGQDRVRGSFIRVTLACGHLRKGERVNQEAKIRAGE